VTDEVVSFMQSRLTDEVLGVREDYLSTARRVVDESYGGLDAYLRASGVSTDDVARLRTALLG
jgi:protein-tyrosine phosphatase